MTNHKPISTKKIMVQIHLWLGLVSGLVIFVSMTSAAIFVWDEELTNWYHADKVFVPEVKSQTVPFDQIRETALSAANGYPVEFVRVNRDPGYAYVFSTYADSEDPGWTWASTIDSWSVIYVDQYTGRLLGVVDKRYDWIFCTRMLHQKLLLGGIIGEYAVGIATLIMFVSIITGIVLWWPKNFKALKQRVWFRWKSTTRWRRKNYDIHNIGGIYTYVFILIFGITGLVWTFNWWTNGIYRLLGNDPEKVFAQVPEPPDTETKHSNVYDKILQDVRSRVKNWERIGISLLSEPSDTAQTISAYVSYTSGTSGWEEGNGFYYNSLTGELYHTITHDDLTLGAKWRYSNYSIHVGSIYGLPTKILACLVALFCATLPVTGFVIWWGRRKKKKKAPVNVAGKEKPIKRKVVYSR